MTRIVTPLARHVLDQAPELPARHRIDAAGGLVEKHDAGLVEDRAAERQPLPPAAGEIVGLRVSRPARPAISTHEPLRSAILVVVQAVQRAEEPDVLLDGQRLVQRKLLRHVADAPLHLFRVAADVDAVDHGRAGCRLQQPAHHADGRRLAGAVGAEEAEDLSSPDLEADAIDGA